jgi:hypothetical protein
MMYPAKYVLVTMLCSIAASSGSHRVMSDAATARLRSSVVHALQLKSAVPAQAGPVAAVVYKAEELSKREFSNRDALLVFVLGIGLVSLQLRRKQKRLQAPRLDAMQFQAALLLGTSQAR